MSQKILIGLMVAVTLGCALTVALAHRLTDAERVHRLAQQIAGFDLPAGFQADYGVEMLGYVITAYRSGDAHLTLVQAPPGIIPEEQAIRGYVTNEDSAATWRDERLVYTTERVIRDQTAQITLTDRTNGSGQSYRSLNMVFRGRQGTALLVINQPIAQWDEAAVEAFIASIH